MQNATAIRAIVGLGNPGPEHRRDRHNAGFWLADAVAQQHGATFRRESRFQGELAQFRHGADTILLLKPGTYMNHSGESVQALAAFYKLPPAEILVAHDELDLPAGTARLKAGGGHGGHNGLRNLHQHIGEAYLRLRIGIGHPGHKERVLGHVLGPPPAQEEAAIRQAIEDAMAALDTLLERGWAHATQQLHSTNKVED